MSLVNFSLPFQMASPSPYYAGNGPHQVGSNLRLNAVLPAASPFSEQRQFQNQPYIPPAAYARPDARPHYGKEGVRTPARGPSPPPDPPYGLEDQYADYEDDFQRTQTRSRAKNPPSTQIRPPPPLEVNRQPERVANHDAPRPGAGSDTFPEQPDGFTRVNGGSYGSPGAKTSVHAVLDYDDDEDDVADDDYYDENIPRDARVTPIQGPIFLKNGSVPVVPLYSYPQYNNGSFVQIPILWTALSVALGVELRGDLVRGTPCIKKYHQLFCPTAGKTYPIERIELFIDENKALMKRMYGDFEMDREHGPTTSSSPRRRKRRAPGALGPPDGGPILRASAQMQSESAEGRNSFFDRNRNPRQSFSTTNRSDSGRVDACESKIEIVTPYWASNSAGKVRAIVNTQHFEQAIHQEVCSKTQTNRCTGDCGCEQKYKWHRLLAYDPDDDCKGIFMDWFLFPSCCVCRCDPHAKFTPGSKVTNSRSG